MPTTHTKSSFQRVDRRLLNLPLLAVLLAGLALRLMLWGNIPRNGLISDEGEYLSAASWLAHGHGFDWYQGYLWTRAPLYPLFLALHLRLFGNTLTPIYVTQTLLSLLNVALVYFLAQKMYGGPSVAAPTTDDQGGDTRHETRASPFSILHSPFFIPGLAALLMALYFPFALYTQVLLSETLFITLLLGGFLALAAWTTDHRPPTTDHRDAKTQNSKLNTQNYHLVKAYWPLALAGLLFGLATLTRSITLLFLPIIALWLLLRHQESGVRSQESAAQRFSAQRFSGSAVQRFSAPLFFVLCSLLVILPWTVYNSRMYGGPVMVDTSGAFNLLLGGRTAYDGNRNDAATRDYVLALLGQKPTSALNSAPCAEPPTPQPSQAARQSAMTREGLCLIAARPLAFAAKSLVELVDLFQINYTGAERFTGGFTTGRLPPWYALSLFLLDDTLYVLTLPLALLGWALARRPTTDD